MSKYPFLNPQLDLDERINDLLSRMTLEEKVSQMPTKMAPIPRLNINACNVGAEAAHGVVRHEQGDITTVYPQTIGFSSTWNKELLHEIGNQVGNEARIIHQRDNLFSLMIWSPTVDMERDPRWGRTEEAYGEDPHLAGELSNAYCHGMRGDDDFYLRLIPSLKHFYANNNEEGRSTDSVSMPPREKMEYYLKAFEPSIRSEGALSVMTAYNSINGVPCIMHPDVQNILKDDWGLMFVVTDGTDFSQTVNAHEYVDDHAESFAMTIKAGTDSFNDDSDLVIAAANRALKLGMITEADLDRALFDIFKGRFRLGEFDPVELNPYGNVDESLLCSKEHAESSLQAAKESIVMLKNDGILPLSKDKKVAFIGPLADENFKDWYTGLAPYEVSPLKGMQNAFGEDKITHHTGNCLVRLKSRKNGKYVTFDENDKALKATLSTPDENSVFELNDWGYGSKTLRSATTRQYVTSADGKLLCNGPAIWGWFVMQKLNIDEHGDTGGFVIRDWWQNEFTVNDDVLTSTGAGYVQDDRLFDIEIVDDGIESACKIASENDYAVVVVGNSPVINAKEDYDREDINLPPYQEELIKAVHAANKNTIVLITASYPFAMNWADENVPAMLYCSHSGQELGNAVAAVLSGEYSPSGRLSMTWYKDITQLPSMKDYDIMKNKVTYMYLESEPLYPFGHGLSYADFKYSNLRLDKDSYGKGDVIKATVDVTNTSDIDAHEVVELYVAIEESKIFRAKRQLKAFEKPFIKAGETVTVELSIDTDELRIWNVRNDSYTLETGDYNIQICRNADEVITEKQVRITGEEICDRDLAHGKIEAMNFDDYDNVILGECKEGGVAIEKCAGTAIYKDCIFDEQTKFVARCANGKTGGTLTIRIDSADGEIIGECEVPPTCGWQIWEDFECDIKPLKGKHDIYISFSYWTISLKEFEFVK